MNLLKEKTKYFIPIFTSIGLLIICVILIILNYNNYKQLQFYETSSNNITSDEKDTTIAGLLSEIEDLKNQIQVQDDTLKSRSIDDMSSLLTEYYTIDDTHTFNTRIEAISPYLTQELIKQFSPNFSDLQGGSTDNYLYHSSITINKGNSYFYFLGENKVMVILPVNITVSTKWGANESETMFFINASYNSATDKWIATDIQFIENAVLQPLN